MPSSIESMMEPRLPQVGDASHGREYAPLKPLGFDGACSIFED